MTINQELLQLRELVKKQAEELASKDAQIKAQAETIAKQNISIENMVQALLQAQKKQFGASSEISKGIEGQLNLFGTAQELAEELVEQKRQITVPAHTRTTRKPGVREEMLEGLPTEVEEYVINPDETCEVCGSDMKVIAKQHVRTEVEFIPAKVKVIQIVRQVAKCTECGKADSPNEKAHFQKAAVPTPILPHSIATPSVVAQVMYQKFHMGIPLSRQEKDWYRLGLILPRGVMANWVIRCSEEWLMPIYDRIHEKLLTLTNLHMDETRIQCNKEEGRAASSNSFMWVIRSGASEELQACFFHYTPSRNGDVAKNLLTGYHGYLTTDAYAGYEKVEHIIRNLCWSHVRRYMIESIPLDSSGKEIPGAKGAEGRDFIDLLFKLEKEMKDLDFDEKKEKRQVASRAILDAFWAWVSETSVLATTNAKLTQALNYATNQKRYLETFLEDGRLPISNNLCEASIKPFATARRAWLFADTPKGARANAVLYTISESAKINGLEVYGYIKYLLSSMPDVDFNNHPELLDEYLPWSESLPEECKFAKKMQKRLKSK